MTGKRYFFVHFSIFLGLCGTFAVAGLSSYKQYLRTKDAPVFHFDAARPRMKEEVKEAARPQANPPRPGVAVLAMGERIAR